MKLRSAPILGCITLVMTLAMDTTCDVRDVVGGGLLDGLWYAAAVNAANQGDSELQGQIDGLQDDVNQLTDDVQAAQQQPGVPGPQGPAGEDGADGLSCWDLNGNGQADPEEDINGDGVWDALDCQGEDGQDGAQGPAGPAGPAGADGADGANCWDTIGDYNGDGTADAQDCLDWVVDNVQVQPGPAGSDGLSCWDLDGDGVKDPAEDINGDGVWDALDCQGADGADGADGAPGADGADGANCWDTIGDYNGDGTSDAQDCLDWILDNVQFEDDNGGVVARGYIDGFGTVQSGSNILGAAFVDVGQYEITVDLSHARADLSDPTLQPEHFPVLLTAYATSADPLPWSQDIAALVIHYQYDSATSLDRVNRTLTLRVYILDAQTGNPVGANFSIMVLEP